MKTQPTITTLISSLCPNGVKFSELGEVAQIKRGQRVTKSQLKAESKFPVYSGGVTPMGYFEETNQPANTVTVVKYGTAGFVNFIKEDFWANDVCYCIKPKKDLNNKYLFYYLKCKQEYIKSQATNAIPAHLPTEVIANLKIPIPPLEVQQEIVKILDSFTELEAELEVRRKQYEHYRSKLLITDEDVEILSIEKIFNFKNGYTPSKAKYEYWKNGDVPWFRMEDIRENGNILNKSIQLVNKIGVKGKGVFPENSIIVATSATIGEHALITIPHLTNQRFVSLSIKDELKQKINIKFLFYYFYLVDEWCLKNTTKSSFSSVDMVGFRKFQIPLPPLSEQERIVAILDKFDMLVNDISVGLPAELKARRQQYEHYRAKLLSFKEVVQ